MSNVTRINRESFGGKLHFVTGATRSDLVTITGYPIGSLHWPANARGNRFYYLGASGSNGGSTALGRINLDTGVTFSVVTTGGLANTVTPVSPYAMMVGTFRLRAVSAQSSSDVSYVIKG